MVNKVDPPSTSITLSPLIVILTFPDETKNVAEISVDTYDLIDEIEQLTIDFAEEDSILFLRLRWDKTGLLIPIN